MKCCSDNYTVSRLGPGGGRRRAAAAFSLIEATTAIAILALISSSVLVVIDRCTVSATDFTLKMQAFEVARENMEKLLASNSVKETSEFGESEKYPDIEWQTIVEPFYEPITSRMWIRGVCSASYTDADNQEQTVELIHWLTDLTKEQMLEIMDQQEKEKEALGEDLIETVEEAAEYAGVEPETIEQWVENGMPTETDGSLNKKWIDLYKQTGGKPTEEQIRKVRDIIEFAWRRRQPKPADAGTPTQTDYEQWLKEIDPVTGLTNEEVENMSVMDLFKLLMEGQGQK
ncbi:MAG: hypothetical protein JSU94_22060 [Phycisphaerales bacterium]|nr:MAG: hypothetical protein JSU94_22060 [Phycisphaerales bacterium]